jgi:hypothetical protein
MAFFILGFCILLRILYQGFWKNRPSQQLFKVFIYIHFAATCFGPRWPSSGGTHNYFREVTSYIFSAHTGTTPQRYKTTQVNRLQNRKRLREQVTRQQQDIKILTRKPSNNRRSSLPPYLHETPEDQADQYYTVFNRQHKTYRNYGRGRFEIVFYGKLLSILRIDTAFYAFNIYILIL